MQDLKSIIIEIGNFLSAQCGNKMLHYKADLNVLHLVIHQYMNHRMRQTRVYKPFL